MVCNGIDQCRLPSNNMKDIDPTRNKRQVFYVCVPVALRVSDLRELTANAVTPQKYLMEIISIPFIPKFRVNKKLALFKIMCMVIMSECLLMPCLLCLDGLKTLINSKEYSLNQLKIKRNIKISPHMVMVTFDQIIMMPTLSIHTNSFLN